MLHGNGRASAVHRLRRGLRTRAPSQIHFDFGFTGDSAPCLDEFRLSLSRLPYILVVWLFFCMWVFGSLPVFFPSVFDRKKRASKESQQKQKAQWHPLARWQPTFFNLKKLSSQVSTAARAATAAPLGCAAGPSQCGRAQRRPLPSRRRSGCT